MQLKTVTISGKTDYRFSKFPSSYPLVMFFMMIWLS